ncbi:MAG: GntR family transcriptional regulator [Halanaerobiales bacterium]
MDIQLDDSQPIYEQIIEHIKQMIVRGEIKPGDKLPSQRELAAEIKVNPNTVQHTYREMESQNLVETRRGRGTFIINDQRLISQIKREMVRETVQNFVQEMKSLGLTQEEIIVEVKKRLGGKSFKL